MINYADLMHRIILGSDTDEKINKLIEDIFNSDKNEFFIFLKSLSLLVVSQQQEIKKLEDQLARRSNQSPDSAN
jgi:hypothetical protein